MFINPVCVLLQVSVKMVLSPAACALLSLSPLLVLGVPPIRTQPEQVHLSYPGKGFEHPQCSQPRIDLAHGGRETS